jgi:rubrerythrin
MTPFIDHVASDNEALFRASEMQVEAFFAARPSKDALVEHFTGRCVNEYMNMEEVAQRLVALNGTASPRLVTQLGKQIFDEANHFRMVVEVLEHLTGAPVDTAAMIAEERVRGQAKGATLLEEFAADDALALYTYQFIAEGRAHRVWARMAAMIDDDFIASRYRKIALDELFHSNIGREAIAELEGDAEAQARVRDLAVAMRRELYEVSCKNTVEVPAARALFEAAEATPVLH